MKTSMQRLNASRPAGKVMQRARKCIEGETMRKEGKEVDGGACEIQEEPTAAVTRGANTSNGVGASYP